MLVCRCATFIVRRRSWSFPCCKLCFVSLASGISERNERTSLCLRDQQPASASHKRPSRVIHAFSRESELQDENACRETRFARVSREAAEILQLSSLHSGMTEPTVPQSPRRYKAPESPLIGQGAAATPSPLTSSTTPAVGFGRSEYDSDEEDLVVPVTEPTITKGSHRRESSSAALLSDPVETPPSPRTRQRQRRLRDYERDESANSGPIGAIKQFVEANRDRKSVV